MTSEPSPIHWLITGASGLLGHGLCRHLVDQGHRVTAICNEHKVGVAGVNVVHLDLRDSGSLVELVQHTQPDVALHAAGITDVDQCEQDEALAFYLYADVAEQLATFCRECGSGFIYISTDHLWDGTKANVDENEPPCPLNAYARSKVAGEELVRAAYPEALIVRTNFVGRGPSWRSSFSDWIDASLRRKEQITGFTDVWFTPIPVDALCTAIIDLVEGSASGTFHVAGRERLSKYDFAVRYAASAGLDTSLVLPGRLAEAGLAAPRPLDMSLSVAKAEAYLGRDMPTLEEGLAVLRTG